MQQRASNQTKTPNLLRSSSNPNPPELPELACKMAEVKVAQLAAYCSERTSYHHGEASLSNAIVKMAQDFVGSNNVPLLLPIGQFGTRLQGGEDSASARYIFTRLNPVTRAIFLEAVRPPTSNRTKPNQSNR